MTHSFMDQAAEHIVNIDNMGYQRAFPDAFFSNLQNYLSVLDTQDFIMNCIFFFFCF